VGGGVTVTLGVIVSDRDTVHEVDAVAPVGVMASEVVSVRGSVSVTVTVPEAEAVSDRVSVRVSDSDLETVGVGGGVMVGVTVLLTDSDAEKLVDTVEVHE
jgi:hypothetical protein